MSRPAAAGFTLMFLFVVTAALLQGRGRSLELAGMALALAAVPFVVFFAASSIRISESHLDVVFCGWRRRYSRSLIGSVAFYTHLWKYNFRGPLFDYGASVLSIEGRRLFGLTGGYWRDSDLKRLPNGPWGHNQSG